jgi:hypothetical protein
MLAGIRQWPSRSIRSRSWLLATPLAAMLALMTTTLVSAQGVWSTLPPMPTIRLGLAAAAAPCPHGLTGTCVYALGGANDPGGNLDTVEAYSPAMSAWTLLPHMHTPRFGPGAASAPCPSGLTGTCVYALGGIDFSGSSVSSAEVYAPATNGWTAIPSMPAARRSLAAATAPCPLGLTGTCVYALGGTDDSVIPQDTLAVYSPLTNAWTTLPPMPTARYSLAAAAAPCASGLIGTCVYALGGDDSVSAVKTGVATVEEYNPTTNAWTSLPSMPTARDGLGAAAGPCPRGATGSCVYAVGGGAGLNTAEAYSTVAGVWAILPSMPTGRDHLAVAKAPCPRGTRGACVYALGGQDYPATATLNTVEALVR